ncbi:hypothetical protein C2E23DRAFT_847697 [Lenzites betulinus]|nr:hypothetical protein C2E23DRAFT_847697 [Lenzites betulinus]
MSKNSNAGESYDVTSRGVNDQGNSYDHRVSESGGHSYHYSNKYVHTTCRSNHCHTAVYPNAALYSDGSYYYSNSNGSTYYNTGDGYSRYTSSDGNVSQKTSK